MNREYVTEKPFLVSICALPRMNLKILTEIMTMFGSPKGVWEALEAGMAGEVAGKKRYEEWTRIARGVDPETYYSGIIARGIGVLVLGEKGYPDLLTKIYDPPPVLYYNGDYFPDHGGLIAVVGSRKATPYGMEVARAYSGDFSSRGLTVVSGAAYGIDTAAHKSALESNGFTVAVLGCGVDVVYPKSNIELFRRIVRRGCLISEYPPGTPPAGYHFPVRNRIIAGICSCVVVIEASEKSGALITADYALEYGRDVFAVPGPVFSLNSKGTNRLIKDGAAPALSTDDIYETLGIQKEEDRQRDNSRMTLPLNIPPDKIDDQLLKNINGGLSDIDDLTSGIDGSPGLVLSRLSMMEIQGLIFKGNDGRYYIRQVPGL